MKIVQIVNVGFEQGGVDTGLAMRRDILRSQGHQVFTISSDTAPEVPHYSDFEYRNPGGGPLGKIAKTTFHLPAYTLTKRVCAEVRPDIVSIHELHCASASVLYAVKNYPTVLCVHGPEYYTKWGFPFILHREHYKTRPYDLGDLTVAGRLQYGYLRWLVRPFFMRRIRRIRHVIAFSRYTQTMLAQEGIESTYIPNGVQLFAKKLDRQVTFRVGYAGRLHGHKGIEYLLDALVHARKSLPALQFVIAGDGPLRAPLERRVRELGLADAVVFLGRIAPAEMGQFYQSIDLLLMASRQETFGKVGVEAMSTGTPVFAPDVGGIGDWLEDGRNGRFITLDDAAAVADSIVEVLSSPKCHARMSSYAASSAQVFDMNNYVDRQQQFFERILKGEQ